MLSLKHTGTTGKSKPTLFKQVYFLNFNIKINTLLIFKQRSPLLKQWQSTSKTCEIFQPFPPFRTTLGLKIKNNKVEENNTGQHLAAAIKSKSKHTGLSRFLLLISTGTQRRNRSS